MAQLKTHQNMAKHLNYMSCKESINKRRTQEVTE